MARQSTGRLLGVAVGFLALVGVGASATHYLQEPYNPGFLRFPTIVALTWFWAASTWRPSSS
jgi:hypothetical protein